MSDDRNKTAGNAGVALPGSEAIAQPSPGNGPVILRIILAVLCLVPAVIGLGMIVAIFGSFLSGGFRFTVSEEVWMQLGLAAAAVLILPPAVVLGIVLRYARWRRAPRASLALAIVTGGAGALVSGMLQTTVIPGDSESYVLLMMASVAGIVAGALPPFLHWWDARDAA